MGTGASERFDKMAKGTNFTIGTIAGGCRFMGTESLVNKELTDIRGSVESNATTLIPDLPVATHTHSHQIPFHDY